MSDHKIFRELCDELQGLSWTELKSVADRSDVTVQTLCYWRTGYVSAPRISTLTKVAHSLGYEIVLRKHSRRLRRVA